MTYDFRLPPHFSGTEKDNLEQLRRYLIQHIQQLQWSLNDISAKIKETENEDGNVQESDSVMDTEWFSVTKTENMTTPTKLTRRGAGCFYKVVGGDHVYVSFNFSFAYNGEPIRVNSKPISEQYRPRKDVYCFCPVDEQCIAKLHVDTSGYIYIDLVQDMSAETPTMPYNAGWIDGYIDYWL